MKHRFGQRLRNRSTRRVALFSVIASFLAALNGASHASQAENYRFGVFPFLPPKALSAIFSPMTSELETVLGKDIDFRTKVNLDDFKKAMKSQEYDIAYLNPTQYIRAHDEGGYLPVARVSAPLKAILVVRRDSGVRTAADLKGRTVGLVGGPNTVDPLSMLITLGFLDRNLQVGLDWSAHYYKNPYACLQGVLLARVDACGALPVALSRLDPEVAAKYHVVFETQSIPHSLIVVRSGFPNGDLEALRKAVLGWQHSEAGQELLRGLGLGPFVEVSDQDYDIVRKMLARMPDQ